MTSTLQSSQSAHHPALPASGDRFRGLLQALKLVLAALVAYTIWRAYQSPDLLLDLSTWRLC